MKMIYTLEDVATALEFISQNEVLAYDTETTGLNPRKDSIIGFGISSGLDGFYVPILAWNAALAELVPMGPGAANVQAILEALKAKKLITWNASFDMRFTKFNLGVDLLPALHADVLLLKHTCDEEFPFGLKEVGAKIFGKQVTNEKEEMLASIKANGGSASEYYKADLALLAKYCVQDCLLTFRLYGHYLRNCTAQGLDSFYYRDEVLPLYKEVTIPMEERGVALDVPAMQSALQDICKDLQALEGEIQSAIEPHLALFTNWFLNKDYPLKTFTGKVPVWAKKYASQAEAWRAENPDGYMFNLLSKHHLKKLFFDTLKCEPLSRTPTGQPQVDEEFMDSVAANYDWVPKLITFNKLTKLKGTYIERFLEEVEGDRFYPAFMQHRTVSGRYAGDLQQLPRPIEGDSLVAKHTSRIRAFIVPSAGNKLVSADYEQLEPSIFAHTSGDPALRAIFNEGTDFYSEVAIRTEGLQGVSSDKQAPNYLGKVNKSARQKAKSYALGIAYGMTGYKLKFEIGVDESTAERLVQDYLRAFPKLSEWMSESKKQVITNGQIATQAGRVRHMPRATSLYRSYGPRIADSLQLWKDFNGVPAAYAKAKADYKEFKNLCNNSINFQVQGLAASIVNRAAISICRRLRAGNYTAGLVMQIHDELVLDVPEAELQQVCEIVQDVMQNIVQLSVPLRTSPQIGSNFKECK